MAYLTAPISPGIWALAIWDDAFSSYTNLYLLQGEQGAILVDCGKVEHAPDLLEAIAVLGVQPSDVKHLILTHGHRDHVGALDHFPAATCYLHPLDRPMVKAERAFQALPDHGFVLDFDCRLLGHHTPGSVALYHRPSGLLLGADHLCFFGRPFGDVGIVGYHSALRTWAEEFIYGWSRHEGNRAEFRYDQFKEGLELLASYRGATAYATGHGGVLVGEIPAFFDGILAASA